MILTRRQWIGVLWPGCALVMAFMMPLPGHAQGECAITQITDTTGGKQ